MTEHPFRFRLERVRALRERTEDEAREHLAGAMLERQRWAARVTEAGGRLDGARDRQRSAAEQGTSIGDMLAHQAFLERAERERASAEIDLGERDAVVEERAAALREAAREHQVLERLKERKAAEHRLEADRRAGAELDEMALAQHRRSTGT